MAKSKRILKMKTVGLSPNKGVGGSLSWRIIFVDPDSNEQIAVVFYSSLTSEYKVSIPVEHAGGWHVKLYDWSSVKRLVERELTFAGKLFNRIVSFPLAFFTDRLS